MSEESLLQRRARWRVEEEAARKTPGHVFAICQNCGETWMAPCTPHECRRCGAEALALSGPCAGCDRCATSPGSTTGGAS